MVEADAGYRGEPTKIRTPSDYLSAEDKTNKSNARARHETVNRRLKQWGCLKKVYRHDLSKHRTVFTAVAVLTQLAIESGEVLYGVDY